MKLGGSAEVLGEPGHLAAQQHIFVSNRDPAPAEKASYEELGSGDTHPAYGVIAYVPSLDGEGSTLLVGGTSKAGTEAAAEFLFNNSFAVFLHSIDSNNALPYFEILLSTENLNGYSQHGTIVCFHRIQTDASPQGDSGR